MEEMTRSEVNKIWENLTIADNFIFQKVMRKKRLCKRFIEKILHIKIRKIMFPETEKDIHIRRDSKLSAQTSTSWTLCARPCMKSANHAAPSACALGISL